jgi:hypothetical protein
MKIITSYLFSVQSSVFFVHTSLLVISEFTYIAMETGSIPLLDDQEAPLVAIINTRNIRKQILQSLNEPVHQLINATIEELVDNLIRGKRTHCAPSIDCSFTLINLTNLLCITSLEDKTEY